MAKQLINTRETKDKLIVQLNSLLNVQHIEKIYGALVKLDFKKPLVEFQVQEDNQMDMAFVQVLISLKKSYFTKNQKIRLKGPLDETQKSVILGSLPDIKIAT